jgi:N-carbamoyl-L-amino-acid hydrolase
MMERLMDDALELRINAARFQEDFEALARIGANPEGGVHRPAFSEAHRLARRWFLRRAQDAGLAVRIDGAANHSALLPGPAGAKTMLLGSHLDSVPAGGRFDGALGVVAALEVLRTLKESGVDLPVGMEAIDFTDEESRYLDYLGSRALSGQLRPEDLQRPLVERKDFQETLASAGLDESGLLSCGRRSAELAGYLELHIEQGPRLARRELQIGVATGIVGIRNYRLRYTGRADHSGTTPMDARRDAGLGACAFRLAIQSALLDRFPNCVGTVGRIDFSPGSLNVVPAQAEVFLETRALDQDAFDELEVELTAEAQDQAERYGLCLQIDRLASAPPVALNPGMRAVIHAAARSLRLRTTDMPSGAGHDAQVMAAITPAGLIFVPSTGGVSHNPNEHTPFEDCVNGANVLLGAALRWARKER